MSQGDESIWIQQDNVLTKCNGEPVQLSGAPQYIDDVFYIPIDCLEEAFGYKADSDIQNATASAKTGIKTR